MNAYTALAVYVLPFLFLRPRDPFQPEFFLNVYFLILIGIGPIALYIVSPDLYNTGKYDQVLLLVVTGYFFINFGFWIGRLRFFGHKAYSSPRWTESEARSWIRSNRRSLKIVAWLLLAAGVLAGILFFLRAGQVPLLAENKEVARVEALSVGGNGYLLYFMTAGMYALIIFSLLMYAIPEKKNVNRLVVIGAFLLVGSLLIGTGSRRYLLWLILYIALVRHYLIKRISVSLVLVASIFGLLLVNLFEMFRNPDSLTTTDLVTTFFFRFVLYVSNLEKVFSTFFEMGRLMYGSTFLMDVATVLPGKQIDYQSWLKDLVGLDFEGFGLPPTLMGDLYINFGWGGVIIGCAFFGFLIRRIYTKLIVSKFTPFSIMTYILLIELASKVITSGISPQAMGMIWVSAALISITTVFRFFR
jgi:oligosaccharide repeat unit polymerase